MSSENQPKQHVLEVSSNAYSGLRAEFPDSICRRYNPNTGRYHAVVFISKNKPAGNSKCQTK